MAGALAGAGPWLPGTAGATVPLHAPEAMAQLHVTADGMLHGLSATGTLWELDGAAWRRIGDGLDPAAPLASGRGRIAGRSRGGGPWVLENGRVVAPPGPALAPHAGLLVLAFGLIAVAAAADGTCHAVRLEPTPAGWRETARSRDGVLPDARPVQFDPDGSATEDNGHVAVFGSPDAERYRHGVLGDAVEPRSLLLLEGQDLRTMARLELPPPWVFEDIAPRPIAWRGRRALLTVRAGPQGAQMAVAALAGAPRDRFELAALGEPIGLRNRWLSPSTDGLRLWAVHTPHLGGVARRYRDEGDRLASEIVAQGVSNHALGERELDISAWTDRSWVVPTQDRRGLHVFDLGPGDRVPRHRDLMLDQPAAELRRWARHGEDGIAVRMQAGGVVWLPLPR